MPDQDDWTSEDGLRFLREGTRWRVEIARELPKRLGDPVSVELPDEGAVIEAGQVLVGIELSKARVEFSAPERLTVWESRHDSHPATTDDAFRGGWHLVIEL